MSTIAVKKVKLGDNADTSKNFLIEVPAVADGTLTIKRENGTAVLSIDANGKAVIPGVVGMVAQVGGIPTGQVVERGSNANGEYVRFADGTQICSETQPGVNLFIGGGNSFNWTYPASFAIGAIVVGYARFVGPFSSEYKTEIEGIETTAFSGFTNNWDRAKTGTYGFLAIGRWF